MPVHVLVERMPHDQWSRLGLTEVAPGLLPELVFRVPPARESVFRGAVRADTFLVSDIIQTWLDVSSHPARGKEQADLIFRQVISPMTNSVKVARDHEA